MGAPPVLVIGMGHPDRGDDAVGRVVADRLLRDPLPGVKVVATDGEAGKLLDLFDEADHVIIVDAGLSGAKPGTIHRLDAVTASLPRPMFAIGLVESIELARTLGTLPRRCVVFAVEGERFDLGAGLSAPVAEAVDALVRLVADELRTELV